MQHVTSKSWLDFADDPGSSSLYVGLLIDWLIHLFIFYFLIIYLELNTT